MVPFFSDYLGSKLKRSAFIACSQRASILGSDYRPTVGWMDRQLIRWSDCQSCICVELRKRMMITHAFVTICEKVQYLVGDPPVQSSAHVFGRPPTSLTTCCVPFFKHEKPMVSAK